MVRRLVNFLVDLEKEEEFLTNKDNNAKLDKMLLDTFEKLNNDEEVRLVEHGLACQLKITRTLSNPPEIFDYSVPIFMMGDPKKFGEGCEQLDMTIQKVCWNRFF